MQITEQLARYARRNFRPGDYALAAVEDLKFRALYNADSPDVFYAAFPGLKRSEYLLQGVARLEINGNKYHARIDVRNRYNSEILSFLFFRNGEIIEPEPGTFHDADSRRRKTEWMVKEYIEKDYHELHIGAEAVVATNAGNTLSYATARVEGDEVIFSFLDGMTGKEYNVRQKDLEKYLCKYIDRDEKVINCPSKELAAYHAYTSKGKPKGRIRRKK